MTWLPSVCAVVLVICPASVDQFNRFVTIILDMNLSGRQDRVHMDSGLLPVELRDEIGGKSSKRQHVPGWGVQGTASKDSSTSS